MKKAEVMVEERAGRELESRDKTKRLRSLVL